MTVVIVIIIIIIDYIDVLMSFYRPVGRPVPRRPLNRSLTVSLSD